MNKIYVLTFQDNIKDPYEPGTKDIIGVYSTIELAQWTAQNHINNTTDLLIKLDFTKDPTYTTYVENKFHVNSYSIEEFLVDNFNITT
jgi:hypothetical protein